MAAPNIQHIYTLWSEGRNEEAIDLLEALTDALPAYAAAHVLLAKICEEEAQWGRALKAWQQARFLAPNSLVVNRGVQRVAIACSSQDAPGLTAVEWEPVPGEMSEGPFFHDKQDLVPGARPVLAGGATRGGLSAVSSMASPLAEPRPPAADDLDRLIEELESARIVPNPDLDMLPLPDLEDHIDDMVSETLARIYASQKQFGEAARVYEQLAEQQPDRAEEFGRKAMEMRGQA